MANKSLAEMIKERVDADRVRMPVHPRVAQQVNTCLAAADPDLRKLWPLVECDPVLLCNLFRAANSSFFAGLQKTISTEEAVTRLGRVQAGQIIERVCRESESGPRGELLHRYMPGLWRHARGCALGARWLANRCGYQGLAEQAFLAGLLHDIGKLVLLAALQDISSCDDCGVTLPEPLLQEVFATMHVEQGLRLFEEWNLPDVYKTVVADHHDDELEAQNILVALVKLANKGCRKLGLGLTMSPEIVLPTTGEAQFLGIDEMAMAEFEIMLEDHFLGGKPAGHVQ